MTASGIYFADYFAITSRALPGRHTLGDLGKRPAEAIYFVTSITSWVSGRNRARAGSLTRVLQATQILILIYGCLDGCLRKGLPDGKPWKKSKKRSKSASGHVPAGHSLTEGSHALRSKWEVMREVNRERPTTPAHRHLRVAGKPTLEGDMADLGDQAVVWLEQVGELHLDANQREVIRRLYDTRVLWSTPRPLGVLGRSSGGDLRHEGEELEIQPENCPDEIDHCACWVAGNACCKCGVRP